MLVWAFAAYQRAQPEIWDGTAAESYAGGSGTESAPYLIANGAQLAKFEQAVNDGTFSMIRVSGRAGMKTPRRKTNGRRSAM